MIVVDDRVDGNLEDLTVVTLYITNDKKEIDFLEKCHSRFNTELDSNWIYKSQEYKYCLKVFHDIDL